MATEDARKLFVAGLSESITEDVLRQLFEATGGKVVEVSLPRERATGKVRGFGFVTLATSDEANKARGLLDGSFQAGRSISVRPFTSEAPKRGERPEGGRSEAPSAAGPAEDRTLYVGNLPYDTSQQELAEFLSTNGVGPVARMSLPTGPDGRMRGYGFLTLATAEATQAALAILQRTDLKGRRLMVNVAHPRADRAPGAGPPSHSRPPPRMGGAMGMGGEPRYPTEPPMGIEAPSDDRRSRSPGPVEGDEEARRAAAGKKKKGAKSGPATPSRGTEERRRGGGSNWQSRVDWDDDD